MRETLRTLWLLAVVIACLASAATARAADEVRVVDLRTDGAVELLGTDEPRPRLEWKLESSRRGVRQAAYQVLVASTPALLRKGRADLWDSGRIAAPRDLARPSSGTAARDDAVRAPSGSRVAARGGEPWVEYDGKPLPAQTRAYWTVRVWDERGRVTAYAPFTWFETALLDPSAWRADWIGGAARPRRDSVDAFVAPADLAAQGEFCRPIGTPGPLAFANDPHRAEYLARWDESCRAPRPAPLLRREFFVAGEVHRARLYVSGLAYAEVRLNGERVGDAMLDPGFTDYGRTVLYVTHDVTSLMRDGANVLGVELGAGFHDYDVVSEWGWDRASWRADPRLRLELHLDLVRGGTQVVRSDAEWRTTDGPTRYDNPNIGETYDGRRAPERWSEPGFDDAGWQRARVVDAPRGTMVAQTHEPIAIVARRPAVAHAEPRPGVHVYDAGEQITGWVEVILRGKPGTVAEIRYAEDLLPDGTVDLTRNLHIADRLQTDFLVIGDDGATRWRPRFSYKGFRYVQLAGPRESALDATIEGLEVQVVRSAVRPTATFDSDVPLLNTIHGMVARTIANNLHGIVTDTPVYEKNGWTGDAQITAPTASALYDMRRLYTKWLRDFRDAQRPDGELPVIVPTGGSYGFTGVGWEAVWGPTPAWDAALFLIPWEVYRATGDARPLAASYAAMQAYVDDFLPAWTGDGLVESELGDWLTPSVPLTRLVPSAYVVEMVRLLARTADLIGKAGDRERYERLHRRMAAAFEAAFWDPAASIYRQDQTDDFAQTAQVLPLAFGLAPPWRQDALLDAVVRDVAARGGNLATGIVGTRYLLKELTRAGRVDAALGIATQTDRPSWGEWVDLGYTSLLEAWGPAVRSQDHHMFGSIGQWLIEDLAGIEALTPGYGVIEIRPEVPSAGLDRVVANLHTVRGPVAIIWQRRPKDGLDVGLTVPAGATALLHLPADDPADVSELAGASPVQPADAAEGVERVGILPGRILYRVGSGTYRFRVGE